jgi:hypothetical protein
MAAMFSSETLVDFWRNMRALQSSSCYPKLNSAYSEKYRMLEKFEILAGSDV